MINSIDIRTIVLLEYENKILLLHRASSKKLFPNLITGIGGRVEAERGEASDIEQAAWRELQEETQIRPFHIKNLRLRLITIIHEQAETRVLYWFLGQLLSNPENLACTEGNLVFYPKNKLPLDQMVPTAREPIQFVLGLDTNDDKVYTGTYVKQGGQYKLLVNGP